MGIGGANGIGFDTSSPAVTESAGLGAARIQSFKTSVQQVINAEHVFSSTGGDGQGVHIMGSARAWFGAQSAISSSGTDGRLYVTSDTSKLFHPGSAGTLLLGAGPLALSLGSCAPITFPQRSYVAMEVGDGITASSGTTLVTIPNSGFSGLPFIQATLIVGSTLKQTSIEVQPVDAQTFVVRAVDLGGGSSGFSFHWMSVGTRTL